MALKRWLIVGLLFVVVAVLGVGTWQVLTARTQLRNTQHEVQLLTRQLSQARAKTQTAKSDLAKTKSELALAKSALAAARTSATAPPQMAPFPFVDKSTLLAALGNAYTQSTGYYFSTANPPWVTAFVNAFTAEEERETVLAEEGEPYYVPDPVSEANAYVASGTLP